MTDALVNSQQLWLCADLHKVKPGKVPAEPGKGLMKLHPHLRSSWQLTPAGGGESLFFWSVASGEQKKLHGKQQQQLVSHGAFWAGIGAVGLAGDPSLSFQETCAVRAERLLLVRINASGGLILRMGAINRCLKHPLARDTPVCLLAVLGEQHSGKSFLLDHLLRGLPSLVAVFLVDTGDVMSPELSRETRVKLCALTMMLSSYQILNTSQELKDTDLGYLEMFVHVAEVMGKHYGMVPIQKLSGKYPKVQELLLGKRARCYLLPAPERQWVNKGQASPGGSHVSELCCRAPMPFVELSSETASHSTHELHVVAVPDLGFCVGDEE
ncbi:RING finger protein [Cricetulus griseus]|nr:RING finger protein [Cricetulus griseus]